MKLKYTDLRVGNQIYWPQSQSSPDEVHTVRPGDFVTFQKYRYELRGVPINEDTLLDIGLTANHHKSQLKGEICYSKGYIPVDDIIIIQSEDGFYLGHDPSCQDEGAYHISEKFYFIHQLQNLYHALTGEELMIKKEGV